MKQEDEEGSFCPLIKDECIGKRCAWATKIIGKHPQKDQQIEKWDCAIRWIPLLQIETSKEVRQGAAATESFRNEVVSLSQPRVLRRISDAS
jgi:hypothetical protein